MVNNCIAFRREINPDLPSTCLSGEAYGSIHCIIHWEYLRKEFVYTIALKRSQT